ncbi:hypothetical protein [Phytohabitans rumicis]|uniref:Uncharacterized protein n=1 Tax=Phytohabitans rumicis TaxID=1076125 RepID=A0A6V8LFX4_9ACTN|nr:hypothetical protein [Phytohabitans rumicis]GFJ95214.1 hypothetical protein Prum_088560 [Phytohabitans rumicis]
MTRVEYPAGELRGEYRDVLRDPAGRVVWDRGWRRNSIVTDCRRLLATFMRGAPASAGVLGLAVGAGLSQWDETGPPPATSGQTALVDPNPFTLGPSGLQIDFLDAGTVSGTPTNRLQIQATLGPGVPPWPGGNHLTGNLREFGLVGQIGGATVLINYVTHLVIAKDPASTLERTIWLTF